MTNGVFNTEFGTELGFSSLPFDDEFELGVRMVGDLANEFLPRVKLSAVPYARSLPGFYTYFRDSGAARSYNIVGGDSLNVIGPLVVGGTISGGGGMRFGQPPQPNQVLDNFATVSGGIGEYGIQGLCHRVWWKGQ